MGRKYKPSSHKSKGHGSAAVANPNSKKFRSTAMSQWCNPLGVDDLITSTKPIPMHDTQAITNKLQKSNLSETLDTVDADELDVSDDDVTSVASRVSLLSTLSNCTNPTFDVLHRNWNSGSALHSDCVAIVCGVTDVINNGGGTQTETEYFAALLTALDGCDGDNHASIAATCYLLSLVMRKVPRTLLRSQFALSSKIFSSRLDQMANCQSPNTVRHLLTCVGLLLRAQNTNIYTESSNKHLFVTCLQFTICPHARVRKEARKVVQSVICSKEDGPHPIAKECAEFCLAHLSSSDEATIPHVLNVLAFVMYMMPQKMFKSLVEAIMKLFATGSVQLTLTCIRTLEMTFDLSPPNECLSGTLNAQIVMALYDLKPLTKDTKLCNAWMVLLAKCLICLHSKDGDLCLEQLPRAINTIIHCMKEDSEQTVICCAKTLSNLFESCAGIIEEKSNGDDLVKHKLLNACIEPICNEINILSIKYLDRMLYVCASVMSSCGRVCHHLPQYSTLIHKLAVLREAESTSTVIQATVDKVMIECVKWAGPEFVLSRLPLKLDPYVTAMPCDWSRSWMLPVLRQGIQKGCLNFFTNSILPLAVALQKRVELWKKSGEVALSTVYSTVCYQLWGLLPGICINPMDIIPGFKDLAKTLGLVLMEEPLLRSIVLKSIRALISSVLAESEQLNEKEELAKFAQNFLPILLNLYLSDAPDPPLSGYDFAGVRLCVLETIRSYLKVAPSGLLVKYLGKAIERMDEPNMVVDKQSDIMDIIIAMAQLIPVQAMQTVFNRIRPWILPEPAKSKKFVRVQKKAYRFIEEILRAEQENCAQFVNENFEELIQLIFCNISGVSHPSTGTCLLCMYSVLQMHSGLLQKRKDLNILMENAFKWSIHCLKTEYNVKTRHTATQLISLLCLRLAQGASAHTEDDPLAVPDFEIPLQIIWGTVVKDTPLMAAGLMAVRIIVLEYSVDMESSVVSGIFGNMTPHFMSKDKACLAQALRLLFTVVKKFPDYVVGQYLQIFLPVFFKQDYNLRRSLRKLNASVLRVLITKFGEVCLLNEAKGDEWPVMINAMRKNIKRARRIREELGDKRGRSAIPDDACTLVSGAPRDTIEAILEEDVGRSQTKSQKSRQPVWIKEDLVDLLDNRSMIQQVSSTDPQIAGKKSGKKVEDGGFKKSADGRLVIEDIDEDDKLKKVLDQKTKNRKNLEEEEGEGEEDGMEMGGRKRKGTKSEAPSLKRGKREGYAPGGTGIHRPLDNRSQSGGDVRRKGDRMDPYAYEQLNVKSLKRRGKTGNQQKFNKFFASKKKHRK